MLLQSEICDFGWPAPDFDLATPEGVRHSRASVMGDNGMLIAFICNHCPYVIAIIDRLAQDMQALEAMGIGCAAVMSNDYAAYPADAPDRMTSFAKVHGLSAPYLVDQDQTVGQAYGAVCTPDPSARVPELLNAMTRVAETGKGPSAQSPSMGCSIKWR